jgi:serine/threonine protein kinase
MNNKSESFQLQEIGRLMKGCLFFIKSLKGAKKEEDGYLLTGYIEDGNTLVTSTKYFSSSFSPNRSFLFKKILGKVGKIGTPYIFVSPMVGVSVIFKESKHIQLFTHTYSNKSSQTFICLNNLSTYDQGCVSNNQDKQVYVGSSEYINETVIGIILNTIFFPTLMDNLIQQTATLKDVYSGTLSSFRDYGFSVFQIGFFQITKSLQNKKDNVDGVNVMELADGTLEDFFKFQSQIENKLVVGSDSIVIHILKQIITALSILDSFEFFHGDLKAGNVFYKINDDYLKYELPFNNQDGSPARSNIRIKIADYGKSAITFGGCRFFCKESKIDFVLSTFTKYSNSTFNMLQSLSPSTNTFLYQIYDLAQLRHTACPTFRCIDLYILIVSLCLQSPLFNQVCVDLSILTTLFPNNPDISIPLNADKPKSVVTANKFLYGKVLRCDALEKLSSIVMGK